MLIVVRLWQLGQLHDVENTRPKTVGQHYTCGLASKHMHALAAQPPAAEVWVTTHPAHVIIGPSNTAYNGRSIGEACFYSKN